MGRRADAYLPYSDESASWKEGLAGWTRRGRGLSRVSTPRGRISLPEPDLICLLEPAGDSSERDAISTDYLLSIRYRLVSKVIGFHLDGELATQDIDDHPDQLRIRTRVEMSGTRHRYMGIRRMDGVSAIFERHANVYCARRRLAAFSSLGPVEITEQFLPSRTKDSHGAHVVENRLGKPDLPLLVLSTGPKSDGTS